MYAPNAYVIRDARVSDVPELVRLGWATEDDWPTGRILVGEIRGVVGAALAIDENRAVFAAMPGAPLLLAHMRMRAAGILAFDATPALAERMRERMRPRVTVAA
ncbi:MAG TPA: hypothetical protein VHJ39_14080 [Solirubrobacteraceae bacterium]|jgi:hypothetical protein|nr:hypothetical protein [Solirubrobacteraceae bacterium]